MQTGNQPWGVIHEQQGWHWVEQWLAYIDGVDTICGLWRAPGSTNQRPRCNNPPDVTLYSVTDNSLSFTLRSSNSFQWSLVSALTPHKIHSVLDISFYSEIFVDKEPFKAHTYGLYSVIVLVYTYV